VADAMVRSINARWDLRQEGLRIPERAQHLIRLAALLHDVGHAPYGHQLEDDYPVLGKHDDAARFEAVLSRGSQIGAALGEELRTALIDVLSAKTEIDIEALPYPYAADIVGNTVCADLLDYTRRDVYYTGLDKRSGWRMLKYIFIPAEGQPHARRVVLDAWKNDRLRSDVISDILDLLDVRFTLVERVIYHHTKMSSGAMIARGVAEAQLQSKAPGLTDDELLLALRKSTNEVARRLGEAIRSHDIYKTVWVSDTSSASPAAQNALTRLFMGEDRTESLRSRSEFENEIAAMLELPRGSILVSCMRGSPLFKTAESRIRIENEIWKLSKVRQDPPAGALAEMLSRHASLWRFYVFLDPRFVEDFAGLVVDAVSLKLWKSIQFRNDISRWQPTRGRLLVDHFAKQVELEGGKAITARNRESLLELAARHEPKQASLFAQFKQRLAELEAGTEPSLGLD